MEGKIDTFANRLLIAMNNKNINQVELADKTKLYSKPISQSLINKYLKGKALARQDNIYLLCKLLDVNEAWIMGYDVPMQRTPDELRGKNSNFISKNNIDTEGLDDNDIDELRRFAEFLKNKKKQNKDK